ncbi:unnamed protein product [Arabidopsis lyrata]|uniref:Uncharacterized protein n=1 Tax=Arabidopsis lyrata subsp. lyrata TaxID=81972 RepID=D7M7V0_ARALL|nr:hypothetical protein ARALYDRAFT_908126 [Arabidopsis lyrata subsp. lyrata]CAH8269813.1 unnamed protein product [Arabidopsis lyrata]
MAKSTFVLVVISFGLLFACVIGNTEKNLHRETNSLLWSRPSARGLDDSPPQGPHKPTMFGLKPWSPSQRVVFRMLPKNVPIPPSGPSRKETPPSPPRSV